MSRLLVALSSPAATRCRSRDRFAAAQLSSAAPASGPRGAGGVRLGRAYASSLWRIGRRPPSGPAVLSWAVGRDGCGWRWSRWGARSRSPLPERLHRNRRVRPSPAAGHTAPQCCARTRRSTRGWRRQLAITGRLQHGSVAVARCVAIARTRHADTVAMTHSGDGRRTRRSRSASTSSFGGSRRL